MGSSKTNTPAFPPVEAEWAMGQNYEADLRVRRRAAFRRPAFFGLAAKGYRATHGVSGNLSAKHQREVAPAVVDRIAEIDIVAFNSARKRRIAGWPFDRSGQLFAVNDERHLERARTAGRVKFAIPIARDRCRLCKANARGEQNKSDRENS